jgi:uncharacterized protein with von Willebrand factor type A (vWA) domain
MGRSIEKEESEKTQKSKLLLEFGLKHVDLEAIQLALKNLEKDAKINEERITRLEELKKTTPKFYRSSLNESLEKIWEIKRILREKTRE